MQYTLTHQNEISHHKINNQLIHGLEEWLETKNPNFPYLEKGYQNFDTGPRSTAALKDGPGTGGTTEQ